MGCTRGRRELAAAYTDRVELKVYPSEQPFGGAGAGARRGRGTDESVHGPGRDGTRGARAVDRDVRLRLHGGRAQSPRPGPGARERVARRDCRPARTRFDGLPLYIGGKSMGGRIASHVAAQGGSGPLAGLVFLGYPLHPPGTPGAASRRASAGDRRADAVRAGQQGRVRIRRPKSASCCRRSGMRNSRRSRAAIIRSRFQVELPGSNRCCRA